MAKKLKLFSHQVRTLRFLHAAAQHARDGAKEIRHLDLQCRRCPWSCRYQMGRGPQSGGGDISRGLNRTAETLEGYCTRIEEDA